MEAAQQPEHKDKVMPNDMQWLLWPMMLLVYGFLALALWYAGATLMHGWLRWRTPGYRLLPAPGLVSDERREVEAMRRLEPLKLIGRISPMVGLVATMIPLGPAVGALSAGQQSESFALFGQAFSGVILALVAAVIAICLHTIQRRWLLLELTETVAGKDAL
jgi:hypothetical protein